MSEERYAIDYGDGSYGVLTEGQSPQSAFDEIDFINKKERPEDRARIVRVRIEILEEVQRPGAPPHAAEYPCCKRPLP